MYSYIFEADYTYNFITVIKTLTANLMHLRGHLLAETGTSSCVPLTAIAIPVTSQSTEMNANILRTQLPIDSKNSFTETFQVCTHAQVASTFRIVLHKADRGEDTTGFIKIKFETKPLSRWLFGQCESFRAVVPFMKH